jgi:N4-gp56 family major capsid protein
MVLANIEGQDKFGTTPTRQAFIAMAHTDITSDLDNQLTGFNSKYDYANQQDTLNSEWGAFRNVRFLVSSVGSVNANSSALGANVYNIFIAGKEAYACIYQDGASAHFIYRDPMYDGPLALNATAGYKMAQAVRLLNDEWLLNLRVTLTT